jgi:hypothetical protein
VEAQIREWEDYQDCNLSRFTPVEVEFRSLFKSCTNGKL